MKCVRVVIVVTLLAASGCSDDGDPDATTPPSDAEITSAGAQAPAPPALWSIEEARVDRIPGEPLPAASRLPASFPRDDSVLPDLLADPPRRARLAYHPRESFDDRGGWATERVFFLGVDGAWRSLEMVDLGLPESTHPGVDTYGAGELSPDGTRWAAQTTAGMLLLDLRTAHSRVVHLPGDYTQYLAWRPDGESIDVMRLSGTSTHRTWSVDARSLVLDRAAYHLPIDGFADDGSVVTFTRPGSDTVRTIHRDGGRESNIVALPYRHARLGGAVGQERTLFGLNRGMLVVDGASWAPLARLRLAPVDAAGWPRGWWDRDTVWFYEGSRGLLTWNVDSGQVRGLTRVRPTARKDTFWSASVAVNLMR